MTTRQHLEQDYRTALLRFLPRRSEPARALAYELGRRAYTAGLSMLDVCRLHHDLSLEVLRATRPEDLLDVCEAAGELLLEALAAFEMTHPGRPTTTAPGLPSRTEPSPPAATETRRAGSSRSV